MVTYLHTFEFLNFEINSLKSRGPVISASPGLEMPLIAAKTEARTGSVSHFSPSSTMKPITATCFAARYQLAIRRIYDEELFLPAD